MVVTDNDKAKGDALAESLGTELFAMRGKTAMPMLNTERRHRAGAGRCVRTNPSKPVVIADVWDNPGGGVAGDGTLVLRAHHRARHRQCRRGDDLGSDRGDLLPCRGRGRA